MFLSNCPEIRSFLRELKSVRWYEVFYFCPFKACVCESTQTCFCPLFLLYLDWSSYWSCSAELAEAVWGPVSWQTTSKAFKWNGSSCFPLTCSTLQCTMCYICLCLFWPLQTLRSLAPTGKQVNLGLLFDLCDPEMKAWRYSNRLKCLEVADTHLIFTVVCTGETNPETGRFSAPQKREASQNISQT